MSTPAQCRKYLKTLIGQVIDPDRVVLGLANFPSNFNFFENLSTEGFYVLILPALINDWDPQDRVYKINIETRIYYSVLPDTNSDFTAIEVVLNDVFQKVTAVASYDGAPGNTDQISPPDLAFSSEGPHSDPDLKPLPYYTSFTFAFWGTTKS